MGIFFKMIKTVVFSIVRMSYAYCLVQFGLVLHTSARGCDGQAATATGCWLLKNPYKKEDCQ